MTFRRLLFATCGTAILALPLLSVNQTSHWLTMAFISITITGGMLVVMTLRRQLLAIRYANASSARIPRAQYEFVCLGEQRDPVLVITLNLDEHLRLELFEQLRRAGWSLVEPPVVFDPSTRPTTNATFIDGDLILKGPDGDKQHGALRRVKPASGIPPGWTEKAVAYNSSPLHLLKTDGKLPTTAENIEENSLRRELLGTRVAIVSDRSNLRR